MQSDDLNEILPDISNISAISKSNSIQIMEKLDHTSSIPIFPSTVGQNATPLVHPLDKAVRSLISYEDSVNELIKVNILYDCLRKVAANDKLVLSETTANKLKVFLRAEEIRKYMRLPGSQQDLPEGMLVLGIFEHDLWNDKFSDEEKLNIKSYLETILQEDLHSFIQRYQELTGNVKDLPKKATLSVRSKIHDCYEIQELQWNAKLEEITAAYQNELLKSARALNEWKELKYNNMNELYFKKAEYLSLKSKLYEVQAKMTKLSCTLRMFTETPVTVDAFRTLKAKMDDKLFELTQEIDKKKQLKKSYEDLKGTEYDSILEKYLQLCLAIEKKKQVLEMKSAGNF